MPTVPALALSWMSVTAQAGTMRPEAPRALLEQASIVVEATVVRTENHVIEVDDERLPVTYHTLTVTSALLGDVTSGQIQVVLPGGPIDGFWVDDEDTPRLTVDAEVLIAGTRISSKPDTLVGLTGWDQLAFVKAVDHNREIAVDTHGNPVADVTCDGGAWLILPLNQAPSLLFDGVVMTAEEAMSAQHGPLFVADPLAWGMLWGDLVGAVTQCIGEVGNRGTTLPGFIDAPLGGGE